MRKFFRSLFRRGDPKAGALFGMLYAVVFTAVYVPACLYFYYLMPLEMIPGWLRSALDDKGESAIWVLGFFMLYPLALQWLFAAHVWRRSFRMWRLAAGLLALLYLLPLGQLATLVLCAVRKKSWRMLGALGVFLCAAVVAFLLMKQLWVFYSMVTVASLAFVVAVAAFPDGRRAPKWGYASPFVFIRVVHHAYTNNPQMAYAPFPVRGDKQVTHNVPSCKIPSGMENRFLLPTPRP